MAKVPVQACGWEHERAARKRGARLIAGLDEVGRGPLFGPVVAAAVILPDACELPGLTDSKKLTATKRESLYGEIQACELPGLTDSKKLTATKRESLYGEIQSCAIAWAIAAVDVETIDRINIRRASLLAMRRAVERLSHVPDFLLIDGRDCIEWPCTQLAVIKGDATSMSIAAASVLAKVYRDRMIIELDVTYPGYGLAKHKGYGTAMHLAALERLGPTPLHRRSFSPVSQVELEFEHS